MAIDIGAPAINRGGWGYYGYTRIGLTNPANGSGVIDTIEVWAVENITGLRVGTFYLVSGTTYRCRDSVTIGNVTAGSKQTFTGLSIDVVAGDYIGCYFVSGLIEYDTVGGAGNYSILGEYIDPNDQAVYTLYAGVVDSLYGMGVEGQKTASDLGSGADAIVSGSPVATLVKSQTGVGADASAKGLFSSDAGYCGEVLEG